MPTALPTGVSYLVYQRETCPETGRDHWQGYLELEVRQRLPGVKRLLGDPAAHLEARRGTAEQAAAYCQKDDSRKEGTEPTELGAISKVTAGQRTDLLAVKKMLDDGASEKEIADEEFSTWAKYFRAIERYKRIATEVRSWKTEVFVVCGHTGVGKSKTARELYPSAYWKPRSNWWCGYDSHETVVLDDFYGWLPWDLLLRLCDRYPLQLETKGGSVEFVAKTIIITSNKPPEEWYKETIDTAPLTRRITKYNWVEEGEEVSSTMMTSEETRSNSEPTG